MVVLDLDGAADAQGEGSVTESIVVDGERDVVVEVGSEDRVLEIAIGHGAGVEVSFVGAPAASVVDVGEPPAGIEAVDGGHWLRPQIGRAHV